ncbi:helix-turn-helix domain-containing protein [Paenibacillus xylaniclasticus]|uniref:helix-turn-helix domain-containing protein n=1 Tax=Paenibacillus xylaniclasticus TaxID=588083 RepID=UPI0013DF40A1|nr:MULTISPECIES: helix-turn-helix transcriptional regulator [Paenibacillus]GFN31802.1 hypothetical protein PCURB6_20620 [Paenibacillus curdlanolyticus]
MTEIKKKNMRYELVSHVKQVLAEHYIKHYEQQGMKYSDMYEDIAEYCGVSPSTISQMKLKNTAPSYIVAVKMAEFVDRPVSDIFSIVESENYAKLEKTLCRVSGCDRVATTRGYCLRHVYFTRYDNKE